MADEQNDPTQPVAPATDPQPDPAPAPDPEAVTPDPSPTPSTSPDPSAPTAGETAPVVPDTTVPALPSGVPVTVNNYTQRDDNDALEGSWVDVVEGPYAGRYGAYVSTATHGEDGYPDEIVVRTRDALNELIVVPYSFTRPSERTGGR